MSALKSLGKRPECTELSWNGSEVKEKVVKHENLENQIPILWSLYPTGAFGRTKITSILNLSTNARSLIAYTCSHIIIIFDYTTRKKTFWPGHRNLITSLSSDKFGKWLVSSDNGDENLIIVWNLENFIPFCTFEPPPTTYATKVSQCAKYVVSVSSGEDITTCNLWVISNERKEPVGSFNFDMKLGIVKSITFSLDSSSHFMLTTNKTVLFSTWHSDNLIPRDLDVFIPSPLHKDILGKLMESVFLQCSSMCLTSTVDGHILVWNDEGGILSKKPLTNKKTLQKWYLLQKNGISVLRQINEFVVTGDNLGVIRFYDYNLCLLYWTQDTNIPKNLIQIEFHRQPREYYFVRGSSQKLTDQYTDKTLPMDCTREGNLFIIQDFIVVDCQGSCYLVDFLKNNCHIICEMPNSPITSIDVHPGRPFIILGNKLGELTTINYDTNQFIYSKSISGFTVEHSDVITCVKYSSKGNCIAVGMERGDVFFVDSCIYEPSQDKPFSLSSSKILKICFSPEDKCMAHADESNCVTLYGNMVVKPEKGEERNWVCCGRICSHYSMISDLKFDPNPSGRNRLFSIGFDRSLVEYSLELSENDGIGIITRDRIEQTAYPLTLNWLIDSYGENCLLITNSEFKYKIYYKETKEYRQTIQCAVYDSPISYCQILNSGKENQMIVFGTDALMGIQMFPLDGNPFKVMGVIAHPVKLLAIASSYDRSTFFTLGINETCMLKWCVNDRLVKESHKQGGDALEPYYCMLEGGATGWLFQQAKDYFYLAQILHEGHFCRKKRNISRFIKICELASVLRSLGFYPTKQEIEEMLHEVSLNVYNSEKKESNTIPFEDFIRLYINHRPGKGITSKEIATNFKILSGGNKVIPKEKWLRILREEGETMSMADISNCLHLLINNIKLNEKSERDGSLLTTTEELSQELTQSMIEYDLLGIPKYGDDKK